MKSVRAAGAVSVVCAAACLAFWQISLLAAARKYAPPPENRHSVSTGLTTEQLCSLHVNEAGHIPVLMYHDITRKERYLGRSIEHFKHDLERLYAEGYRPVNVSDFISNRMDVPAGCSPVVLTFDDSRKSQFKYLPDGSLDPNCAIAILNNFSETHAGWSRKATFFLLPLCSFRQLGSDVQKLKLLTAWGYELGNHTVTHANLKSLNDTGVQREVAGCAAIIHQILPDVKCEALAFPGGRSPRNHALIARGEYHGFHYGNRSGFLAANDPTLSPICTTFNPMRIQRIEACVTEPVPRCDMPGAF